MIAIAHPYLKPFLVGLFSFLDSGNIHSQMTAFLSIKTGKPDRQCVIEHLDSLSEEYLKKMSPAFSHLPGAGNKRSQQFC